MSLDVEGWLVEDKVAKAKKSSGWGKKSKKDEQPVYLERWWVDHQQRRVTKGMGSVEHIGYGRNRGYANGHGHGKGKKQAASIKIVEDRRFFLLYELKPLIKMVPPLDLDLEYRYWAFMESHPAHLPVSQRAKVEALDILTWALTDRLLPSHRAIAAPFTREECQELRVILMSFNSG